MARAGRKEKKYGRDLTQGPILPQMLGFVFPIMLGGVLQILFNTADTIVVGRFAGHEALAAVGSNSSLIGLMTNVFIGLSVGANIICARYIGEKRPQAVHDTVHTAMLLSVISGVLLLIIGQIGGRQFLVWVSVPEDVIGLSALYLRIYFCGMPFMMIYNFGSAILRSVGDTTRTLYYLVFSGVVNVLLNLLFVIGFHMSVAGVAIATVVSQGISAALVVRCLMKEEGPIRLDLRDLCIQTARLKEILRIGLPASVQGSVFSFANLVIQAAINTFGSVLLAGNSAAATIEGFVYLPINAFYQAVMPFISQNVGARQYQRLNRVFWSAAISVFITGEVLGLGTILFSKQLLGIFTGSPEVIAAGQIRFYSYFAIYGMFGLMEVLVGSIRGLGYSLMPTIIYIIAICGVRVTWLATVFQVEKYHKIQTVYAAFPFSWFITLPILIVCYLYVYRHTVRNEAGEDSSQ